VKVSTIKPHLTGLWAPEELRRLRGWLTWRFEQVDGEPKPRKIPYYAGGARRHGVNGRPEDREHLVTFEAACAAAARRGMDGIGLAMLPGFGVTALDFDACMGPDGVRPEVLDLVGETYAEFSPSGQGVRAFFTGDLGNHKDHGEPFGFEAFTTKGFVTFTGNALPHVRDLVDLVGTAVAAVPAAVHAYCTQRFGARTAPVDDDPLMTYSPPLGLTEGQLLEALDVLDAGMRHDPWLQVGMALHHETNGEGFDLWDEWSSHADNYPGPEALRSRWDSFGRAGGRVVTARTLVKMANEQGARINVSVNLAEFDRAAAEKPGKTDKPPRFPLLQAGAFAVGQAPGWIIKGVLPRAELAVVYGESTAGKTFAVMDLALAIARGVEWRGNRTRKGRVVYVAAEGSGGMRKRLAAYAKQHGIDLQLLDLYVVPAAPNLLLKDDALELSRAIAALGPADLVVLDTLAQVTPGGNENAAEDMGKALAHCKGIHRATGALVLLVHHSGKDTSKGARGWSGLRAAADAELEVVRLGTARVVQVRKQKDGDDHGRWAFDLLEVPLGMDEDGDVVSSCVVVEAAMPVTGGPAKPMGPVELVVNAVIQGFAEAQTTGIEVAAVLAEAARRLEQPADGKRDTRKQRAARALKTLCEGDEAPYWIEGDSLTVM
jgi:RecA/RadA recombinase